MQDLVKPIFEEKTSQPYILRITNNTDQKLDKVSLFNYDFNSQSDVTYTMRGMRKELSYSTFLRLLSSTNVPKTTIGAILIKVVNADGDAEIIAEQKKCAIEMAQLDFSGAVMIDAEFKEDEDDGGMISIKGCSLPLYNKLHLTLSCIMPKTELTFIIVPSENDDLYPMDTPNKIVPKFGI
jgi:hypothetical protein